MVKSQRAKRMAKHHRRHRRDATLNLVSLMDIFTILVFFLLVNSSNVEVLPNVKNVQLPESIAEKRANESVVIVISDTDIIVPGQLVAKVDAVMATPGNAIPALRQAVKSHNDCVLHKQVREHLAGSSVTIMGDNDTIYRRDLRVMEH